MIEESILKSNFVGRDGFRWWIGQIAPEECQGGQINQIKDDEDQSDPWGNRIKVRIMGYHPQDPEILSDKDLPWAQILLPPTAGSGGGGLFRSTRLTPGDSVFGFFMDGDDAQLPVIIGIFGRPAAKTPLGPYSKPFQPYTGFTKNNQPSKYFLNTEIGDQSGAKSTSLPLDLTKEIVNKVNASKLSTLINQLGEELGEIEFNQEKIMSSFDALGSIIDTPTVSDGISAMELASREMKTEMKNMEKDLKLLTEKMDTETIKAQFEDVLGGINTEAFKLKTKEIQGLVKSQIEERKLNASKHLEFLGGGIAKDMMGKLQGELAQKANLGLKKTYNKVFAAVFAATKSRGKAKQAGIAAQAAFINPLKDFGKNVPCLLQNVLGGLGDAIKGIIGQLFDNVMNFTACIMDQAIGGILNQIIGGLTKGIAPFLGGLGKILGGFSPGDFLRGKAANLMSIASMFKCKPDTALGAEQVQQKVLGIGPMQNVDAIVDNILALANTADSLTEGLVGGIQGISNLGGGLGVFDFMNPSVSVPGFKSPLGECYSGPPLKCAGLKLNIFGGGGFGAKAGAIFGNKIGTGIEAVGSLIGIDLTSGGSGYNAAPFIEIVDTCKQGYGATARAIVDFNPDSPNYQQVVDIIVITPGENYPIKEVEKPVVVDHVTIVNPGEDYDKDDKVTDNAGNEYDIVVDNFGRIIRVTPPNSAMVGAPVITEFPELIVESKTGFGAILRAQLKPRPPYQGEVKQVIDCVS